MMSEESTAREQGFIKDETPWEGGWVHSRAFCLKADNPSPMTYTGTNTWIVLGPSPELPATEGIGVSPDGRRKCVVVDPGPAEHVPVILSWCEQHEFCIGAVITTHLHADHTEGAQACADAAQVRWLNWLDGSLREGMLVPDGSNPAWPAGMPTIEVLHLPGHSADSVGLIVESTMFMLTGDVIFSQGPTVIKHPDGNLADYLDTLEVLRQCVRNTKAKLFLTGHGYPIRQCQRIIAATREHRTKRLASIQAALDRGVPATPEAIVAEVYAGTPEGLIKPALMSAEIQLEYLLGK